MNRFIRMPYSIITGALLAVFAGCINTQPLTAQTGPPPTVRDSAHAKVAKASTDTIAAALTKYCKTKGAATYVCAARGALARTQAAESSLVAFVPAPTPAPIDSGGGATVTAELPRVYLNTAVSNTPSSGRTLRVGTNLQQALDSARFGDRVVLPCDSTYVGNFVLGAKLTAFGWITVTSDCPLPAEGVRVSPATQRFARLVTPNVSPALSTAAGAQRWRVIGLEVTNDTTALFNYGLVLLGDGSPAQNTNALIPRNLILDRVYIHGTVNSDSRRCVALNSDSTAIIDSYISECHSNGFDTQAIWGWNANGPFKIANNHLEASTEVVGSGGADPAIPNLVPSDFEIVRNHITRPMSWKGGPWFIKNLVEFKNARRVLVEGNVLENNWPAGQFGHAFMLFSVNQTGGCAWCVVRDLTIRNNLIRNSAGGVTVSDMYRGAGSVDATPMSHLAITNNVFLGTGNAAVDSDGSGFGFLMQNNVASLRIEHNTIFVQGTSAFEWISATPMQANLVRNNLGGGGRYEQFVGPPSYAWTQIVDTTTSAFAGNVLYLGAPGTFTGSTSVGNSYPSSLDAIGLVGGSAAAFDVNATLEQLGLSALSPFKGKATDGTDPGADIAAVKAAIAGVVQAPSSTQRLRIRKP